MNNREFSNQFDTLVSSYRRFRDFDRQEPLDTIEFDEYEKSLYLTKAQEELVLSLYNGRNSSLQGFEETEELRRYLSGLIGEADLDPVTNSSGKPLGLSGEKNTKFFTLPENLWFITYEEVKLDADDRPCAGIGSLQVTPVRQDEYHRLRKNPFRGANNRRALRLDLPDNMVEIVSRFAIAKYYVRYLRKLSPIVLEDMPNDLTINDTKVATESEVHESLHQRILEMAVEMAMQSKLGSQPRQTRENNENR